MICEFIFCRNFEPNMTLSCKKWLFFTKRENALLHEIICWILFMVVFLFLWNFANYQTGYGKEFRITLKEEKDVDLIGLARNRETERTRNLCANIVWATVYEFDCMIKKKI